MTTVRAGTVVPGVRGSATLEDRRAPVARPHEIEIAPVLVGVCGTDAEIADGEYGEAPPGARSLVLGHEAVARVVRAPDDAALRPGDLVVPVVRRPDPVPCPSCAVDEWDMCTNGRYTEHGIKGLDGWLVERAVVERDELVPVPPALGELAVLAEPASVVAKAWEQIERVGARASWTPRTVLVTGAGPVGMLAALLARQRGFETHVLDRVVAGAKPELVADIGAEYHTGGLREACAHPDVVLECTGVGALVLDAIESTAPTGIVCLTGLSSGARTVALDAAALNRKIVLENDVVFGTVNANRRHYEAALDALALAEPEWLARVIARRVPLSSWDDALHRNAADVKVVVEVGS